MTSWHICCPFNSMFFKIRDYNCNFALTMKEPKAYITYLRLLATIAVIAIHASTGYLKAVDLVGFDWNYANIINSFTRLAVPLFVMLSGALMLEKEEPTAVFYQKRMSRILWPFLFWSLIYLAYHFYRYTHFSLLSSESIWKTVADKLAHGSSVHLWYLYMICGLYLAIPFLRKIIRNCSDKEIITFLVLWFLALLFTNRRLTAYMPAIDLTFFSGYLGYLVLGYFLAKEKINVKPFVSASVFMVLGIASTIGTFALCMYNLQYDTLLYGYLFPNQVLLASALFLFVKAVAKHSTAPKFLTFIDNHSFGIYLSHILVLNYIHPLVTLSTLWKLPVVIILTFMGSFLITFLLRKIPYGKYISG